MVLLDFTFNSNMPAPFAALVIRVELICAVDAVELGVEGLSPGVEKLAPAVEKLAPGVEKLTPGVE